MYQPKGVPSSNFSWNNSSGHGQYIDSGANAIDSMDGGNHSNNPSLASKQRLRWTNELHERFVDAVGQLGGPDRKPLNYFFSVFVASELLFPCVASPAVWDKFLNI